jgi:hypothetical protein
VSIYGINVPAPDAHDYHAADLEERRRRALKALDPGDVLAQVDDLIASEPDPKAHPLYPMVLWLLDQAWTPGNGAEFWDQWKTLAIQAIDRLVEARLQGED